MKLSVRNIFTLLLIFIAGSIYSQGLSGLTLEFNAACVSQSHNTFTAKFKWTPPMPNGSNQYILELSDETGNFSNPKILGTYTDRNNLLEPKVTFQFPKEVHGNAYKIRVRSTYPAHSVESTSFSAYFLEINTPLVLNGGHSDETLCPGHSKTISVDKQRAKAYRWYKDNQLIANEKGHSLVVSQAGTYYAEVDYGDYCSNSASTRSNNVVFSAAGTSGLTISGTPADAIICKGNSYTMTASVQNATATYKWFRNGTQISSGVGMYSFTTANTTSAAGIYHVEMFSGQGCSELSNKIEVRFKDSFLANISSEEGNVILPGKTKNLSVTTTAPSPTYQWYKNDVEIVGANGASYTANQAGKYHAKVTQSGDCANSVNTQVITLVNPDKYTVTIDYKTPYTDCTYDKIALVVKSIVASKGSDKFNIPASDYNLFTYRWLKDETVFPSSSTSEVLVSSIANNGRYSLQLGLSGASGVSFPRSNELTVQLADGDYVKLNNGDQALQFCSEKHLLKASVEDANATYTWFKDGVSIKEEKGGYQLEISQTGLYHVQITTSGDCKASSNFVYAEKKEVFANWINQNTQKQAFLNYKTYPLGISHNMTNPTIQWYRNNMPITGENQPNYTVNQPGSYHVELTEVGGCGATIRTTPKQFVAPIGFNAVIGYRESQNACGGTEVTMELQKLEAILSKTADTQETVLIPANEYEKFDLQWVKNDVPEAGQKAPQITIHKPATGVVSDNYSLNVGYGTIIVNSNQLSVSFITIPDVTISSGGSHVLCDGSDLILKSSLTSSAYNYQWYRNNELINGATSFELKVTEPGGYHVKVSSGGCSKISETANVTNFSTDVVTVDVDVTKTVNITGTDGVKVTASGADTYLWVAPDGTVVSNEAVVILKETGKYILTATVGGCKTTIILNAQAIIINDIPNVVTPNGDGSNDTWAIPSTYSNRDNVKVTIYSPEGKVELSTTNYKNDWPKNYTKDLNKRALVYLYVIEIDGKVEKQGTISVLK
ncbi:gliding motility-associated C-terminal domain-containing protein [Capnocytophaga canimorsus]|uniref:Ig-like domain-containing protein n=1 Tax=Capnocytophaga canimorsus TaxID=28188 RepID=UPI0037D88F38